MPQPSTKEGRLAFQRIQELITAATDRIPAPSDASTTRSHTHRNSRDRPPHQSNISPRHNLRHRQGPAPQPDDNGGGQGGGGGGHSANRRSHEDDGANNDLGSHYYSDGEGGTRHDGRNPRNQPEPAPRAIEGDPSDLVGPLVFGYRIWSAPTPRRFCVLNIEKYDGETNPKIWLVNYQLAMKAASAPDTFFMIQYLLIYVTHSARNWLNNLREGTIKRWTDLEKAFYNHFEGAYTKQGTSWDLLGCKHKTDESLHDYIKHFT